MDKQIDQTKFVILRYDNYISQANVKGNFLLAFNTFLIGGIIANYSKIIEFVYGETNCLVVNILLVILFCSSLITAFFVIKAVYPFLNSNDSSKDNYHSHIFFNSVSKFTNGDEYYESLLRQRDEDFEKDLAKQAFMLAGGLKRKYVYLQYAMLIIYFEMLLIFLLLIFIVI